MADDTENHTIKLLREMRREIKDRFDKINERFDAVDERFDAVGERFDGVDSRIDGLTYIVTMMAANMGGHEDRIETLEETVAAMEPEQTV